MQRFLSTPTLKATEIHEQMSGDEARERYRSHNSPRIDGTCAHQRCGFHLAVLASRVASHLRHRLARTAVNDDAEELLALGRTLYERLGVVARHLDALGSALKRSVTVYNKVAGSLETRLLVTARSFETLAQDVPDVCLVGPDDAQLRTLSAAELVENTSDDE